MDFCRNVSVSSEFHQQEQVLQSPSICSKLGAAITPISPLDDLFSAQNTEVDVSLEWLSVFVEDCLSSSGNYLPPPTIGSVGNTSTTPELSKTLQQKPQQRPCSLENFAIPGKARSKRKRITSVKTSRNNPLSSWSYIHHQSFHFQSSDPPLLHQAYWLADSELITPKKEDKTAAPAATTNNNNKKARHSEEAEDEGTREEQRDGEVGEEQEKATTVVNSSNNGGQQQQQARRCSHCLSQKTPQWRAGPLGPKTLCNACGVRYKSGRLLPEYRPAKSPTFVSYLHSNSHKKVMEMRMATSTSTSTSTSSSPNSFSPTNNF